MRPIAVSLFTALLATAWAGIAFAGDPTPEPVGSAMVFAGLSPLELDDSFESRAMAGVDAALASEGPALAGPSTMDCSTTPLESTETCVVSVADVGDNPGPAALPMH